MPTLSYRNSSFSEHMLVVVSHNQTAINLTYGDSVALTMCFDRIGRVIGEPAGTLVDMFGNNGIRGEPLYSRLKLIYLDRTQSMMHDMTGSISVE